MKILIVLVLFYGLAAAKPSNSFFNMLFEAPEVDKSCQPICTKVYESNPQKLNMTKWYHWLRKESHLTAEGKEPKNHPDEKYEAPGDELIEGLKHTIKPAIKIKHLLMEDAKNMTMQVVKHAMAHNIHQAKHVAGEYFIAMNRRFLKLVDKAQKEGLFDGGKDKEKSKRGEHNHLEKTLGFVRHFLNPGVVYDCIPDGPFVRQTVHTVIKVMGAFKEGNKVRDMVARAYFTMIRDIIHLAKQSKDKEQVLQRAGDTFISFFRRFIKIFASLSKHASKHSEDEGNQLKNLYGL